MCCDNSPESGSMGGISIDSSPLSASLTAVTVTLYVVEASRPDISPIVAVESNVCLWGATPF